MTRRIALLLLSFLLPASAAFAQSAPTTLMEGVHYETLAAPGTWAPVGKNEIEVVLTDMVMPFMDGPATIRALQRMNPGVRIIAASCLLLIGLPGGTTNTFGGSAGNARRSACRARCRAEGGGDLRRLSAELPARICRMGGRGEAAGDPRQADRPGGRVDGRGQEAELEIRGLLSPFPTVFPFRTLSLTLHQNSVGTASSFVRAQDIDVPQPRSDRGGSAGNRGC